MKQHRGAAGGHAIAFRRTHYAVALASLLAAAAALGNEAAAAAQPLKTLDLRLPDPWSIPLTHSPLTVAPIGMDDSLDLVIVSAPQFPEIQSDSHAPPIGFGSLYWAFRNPTQAWRILLPEQPPST
jgi:hypothetical protein